MHAACLVCVLRTAGLAAGPRRARPWVPSGALGPEFMISALAGCSAPAPGQWPSQGSGAEPRGSSCRPFPSQMSVTLEVVFPARPALELMAHLLRGGHSGDWAWGWESRVQRGGGCEAGAPGKLLCTSASSSRGGLGCRRTGGWPRLRAVPVLQTLEGFWPEPRMLLGPPFPRNVLGDKRAFTCTRTRPFAGFTLWFSRRDGLAGVRGAAAGRIPNCLLWSAGVSRRRGPPGAG